MDQVVDRPRPPGRPRDQGLDRAIHAAVVELLAEGGQSAASLDEVAARAGVGKATIYRRWTSKHRLIADVVIGLLPVPAPVVDQGSLHGDATALLCHLADLLTTRQALAVRRLLPDLGTWPGLTGELRRGVLDPWQARLHEIAARDPGDGGRGTPVRTEIVLRTAALSLCAEWLADADAFTRRAPASVRAHIDELVKTLVSGPVN